MCTEFPNLPHILDGDKIITDSDAICHYLCFKFKRTDLIGESPLDRVNIMRLKGVVDDIKLDVGMLAYSPNYEKEKNACFDGKINQRLNRINNYLQNDNKFLNNGKLCYYDFYFYEIMQVVNAMNPGFLDKF